MQIVNISQKFELFNEYWQPRGELVIIPKGVEHCPVAEEEVQVILLEPKSTLNTGDQQNERTVEAQWI